MINQFSVLQNVCSSLIDVVSLIKDLKCWWLLTTTKILNVDYLCSINIQSACCSGVTDGREQRCIDHSSQLNIKTRPPLSLSFGFPSFNFFAFCKVSSINLWFYYSNSSLFRQVSNLVQNSSCPTALLTAWRYQQTMWLFSFFRCLILNRL